LQPKPVPEPEPELAEGDAAQEGAAEGAVPEGAVDGSPDGSAAEGTDAQTVAADAALAEGEDASADDAEASPEAVGEGEIEIREGETLAEIKERMKQEQKNAKKPTIPPELLNNAKSYEDKVGVVRMVVHQDQARVAAVIRGMIQIK
jgi:hypothetical protein